MKLRKKPIIVEAMQWDGSTSGAVAIYEFMGVPFEPIRGMITLIDGKPVFDPVNGQPMLRIVTLEGEHWACAMDWIIEGVQHEFYPCKPSVVTATYDLVS